MASGQEPAFEWASPGRRTCLVSRTPLPCGGMTTTFTDVTEQRSALRVIAQACNAAGRGNKAKTKFLNRMRPEFRTPLHSIISFVEMLQNRTLSLIGCNACVWGGGNNKAISGETLLLQISAIIDLA
ncbi:MAG: PAS-domain containing protein [Alphaproteobacteria bacterium]|nr:PAS-domain containing protein [Alphaproteobacteria bacterium]